MKTQKIVFEITWPQVGAEELLIDGRSIVQNEDGDILEISFKISFTLERFKLKIQLIRGHHLLRSGYPGLSHSLEAMHRIGWSRTTVFKWSSDNYSELEMEQIQSGQELEKELGTLDDDTHRALYVVDDEIEMFFSFRVPVKEGDWKDIESPESLTDLCRGTILANLLYTI